MIKLPAPKGYKARHIDPMQYHIAADGSISHLDSFRDRKESLTQSGKLSLIDRTPEEMVLLSNHLSAYSQISGAEAMVVVHAEAETPAQYVIDFLNVATAHKIEKITFKESL